MHDFCIAEGKSCSHCPDEFICPWSDDLEELLQHPEPVIDLEAGWRHDPEDVQRGFGLCEV